MIGTSKLFNLKGKTAIVTGASSGIGKEITFGLAEAGCEVMLVARDKQKLIQTTNQIPYNRTSYFCADVSESKDVQLMTENAIVQFGKIDVLVNCVGTTFRAPFEDVPDEQFDHVFQTNARSCFLTTKYVGREMLKSGKGHIINIGSVAGSIVVCGSSAYCASKAAMIMITKSAAVEWASRGIRVNIIMPGAFNTPLLQYCIDNDPEYEKRTISQHPIGRFGNPTEIVGLVIYLACDNSDFMTGSVLYLDGGRSSV